ncbi:hypothetical protein [Frankia sp. AgB32]|uniref:hypothetical protein n=1 Tax=Frankia sp. AgB32 TaxID=631119 RepID=UPI00200EEC84|nr:hypothetical protein [Frankia sp. AgB32]MCK9898295.1 hypothetical protein [Frankia sp. AgB32]
MTMTVAEPTTAPASPPPATTTPHPITLTVTVAGLFDVLTNTVRAVGTDPTLPQIARLRLHLADARLHALGTDRYRIHRDWTPTLDNTPAHLTEPLALGASDVATLRALLRRRLAHSQRTQPATLTVGPDIDGVRPIQLTLGSRPHTDTLTLLSAETSTRYFPDMATAEARFAGWDATDAVHLNPRYLADAARLTHDGRPISRHAGLEFRFRAAPPDGAVAPVRLTSPARPSWTADVMPIRLDDAR